MDLNYYKHALESKANELEDEIVRAQVDGREYQVGEPEDSIDAAISSEGQAAAFEQSGRLSDTLEAVRDALRRIDEGTYGRCLDCGRVIEEARLRAVPWTLYCKEDQEKHDAARAAKAAADIS